MITTIAKFDRLDLMKEKDEKTSDPFTCGNVRWCVGVRKHQNEHRLFLRCLKERTTKNWFIVSEATHTVIKNNEEVGGPQESFGVWMKETPGSQEQQRDLHFRRWVAIEDHQMENSSFTVKLTLEVDLPSGLKKNLIDFTDNEHADVIIKANNQEFFLEKAKLAADSEVFETMFKDLHDNDNAERTTIQLPDNQYDLQNLFEIIYGSRKFNDDTVDGIIELADKYRANRILTLCQSYLVFLSGKSAKSLFYTAVKYDWPELEEDALTRVENNMRVLNQLIPENPSDLPKEKYDRLIEMKEDLALRNPPSRAPTPRSPVPEMDLEPPSPIPTPPVDNGENPDPMEDQDPMLDQQNDPMPPPANRNLQNPVYHPPMGIRLRDFMNNPNLVMPMPMDYPMPIPQNGFFWNNPMPNMFAPDVPIIPWENDVWQNDPMQFPPNGFQWNNPNFDPMDQNPNPMFQQPNMFAPDVPMDNPDPEPRPRSPMRVQWRLFLDARHLMQQNPEPIRNPIPHNFHDMVHQNPFGVPPLNRLF